MKVRGAAGVVRCSVAGRLPHPFCTTPSPITGRDELPQIFLLHNSVMWLRPIYLPQASSHWLSQLRRPIPRLIAFPLWVGAE